MRLLLLVEIILATTLSANAATSFDLPTLQPEISLWTRTTAPVFSQPESIETDDPSPPVAIIPAGTKVNVAIVSEKGKPWSEWDRHDKPRAQIITKRVRANWQSDQADGIFFVKAEITEKNIKGEEIKKNISGYISRDAITNQQPRNEPVLNVFTPFTPKYLAAWKKRKFKSSYPPKNSIASNNPYKEIMRILHEFHNSFCADIHADLSTDRDLKKRLLQAWDRFKKFKHGTADEKWAAKAEEVDILARTVLHEGHIPGTFSSEPPHTDECEWMLIAQSIYNRRKECTGKKDPIRGCREGIKNDLIGVATEPSQINIWMDKYLLGQTITSCYLRSDLKDAKSNSYLDKNGNKMPAVEAKIYAVYKDKFRLVLSSVLKIMGYENAKSQETDANRATRYFEITNYDNQDHFISDGKKYLLNDPQVQKDLLLNLKAYYHPLDMGTCSPQTWASLQYVRSTDIKCEETKDGTKKTAQKYIPLFRERVQVLRDDHSILNFKQIERIRNKNSDEYLPFRLRITPNNVTKEYAQKMQVKKIEEELIDGESICKGARIKVSDLVEPSESFACMPAAQYPKCINNSLTVNAINFKDLKTYLDFEKGKLVSVNLLSPRELEEIRAKLGNGFVTDTHLEWNKLASQGVDRAMVGVSCKNIWNKQGKAKKIANSGSIDFNGMCDARIIPLIESFR